MERVENVVTTNLTVEEREILAQADTILYQIQMALGKYKGTLSLENGDIVMGAELGRVRGILSHYADNGFFKLIDAK